VIGADGITLDLNGHLIDGDGTAAGGCNPRKEFCDTGVVNFRHDGVTVMHGSMRQFDAGVNFGEVRHDRVLGISPSRNRSVGIQLFNSSRSLVRDSSGSGSVDQQFGSGVAMFDSHRVRILDNAFRNNAAHGIFVVDSAHNRIKGNRLSRNGEHGILIDHSDNNLIKGNRFSRQPVTGLLMEGGESNRVSANRFVRLGNGVVAGPGSDNVITGNHFSHINGVHDHHRGDGVAIEKGHGNVIAHNVVVHSRGGIRLGINAPSIGGAKNLVSRNLVRGSHADAFIVLKKDDHSVLRRNVAIGAGDDGFDINSKTAKLTGNRAVRNGDLGIEAVRGVIDGGGNIARRNGDPRQCTNIACG
jgi:parallel beta-helix repeat protein